MFISYFLVERRKRSPTLNTATPPEGSSPTIDKKRTALKLGLTDNERKIKTISIRDSLHLDSKRHSGWENISNSSNSPYLERKENGSRNSLDSSSDSFEHKKKGFLGKFFNKMKMGSTDNLLDLNLPGDSPNSNRQAKSAEYGKRFFTKRRSGSDVGRTLPNKNK